MMKKVWIATLIAAVLNTPLAVANENSERSLVKRAFTLKDNEFQIGAAIGYGETGKEDDWGFDAGASYGVTDDFTIGLGDLRYRVLARPDDSTGLEVTLGGGLKGYMERIDVEGDDEVFGYGVDVTGKYVFSEQVAVTFGSEYVFWNDIGADNRKEMRYSVGVLYEPVRYLTLMADYTFRDLDDFTQNNAYIASAGVNYTLNKRTDVGIAFSYSDFDAPQNGFNAEYVHKRNLAAYAIYRF